MTRYLLSLGHRRIGYVVGPPEQRAAHDRFSGYQDALSEEEIDGRPLLLSDTETITLRQVSLAVQKLLDGQPQPDGHFFATMMRWLLAPMRLSMKQVSECRLIYPLPGFDDVVLSRQVWPALTTIKQPICEIAKAGTNLLLDILNDEELTHIAHEIPTSLIVRKSTGPPMNASLP